MDFRFTDDQLSIQSIARDFAQKRIAPVAAELDAKGQFPLENIQEMGQLGLMGIEVPEEYGGAGTMRFWAKSRAMDWIDSWSSVKRKSMGCSSRRLTGGSLGVETSPPF